MSDKIFVVVWKYNVIDGNEEQFEYEYGSNGRWVELFKRSGEYINSHLIKDKSDTRSYLLFDCWNSEHAYNLFLQQYGVEYSSLAKRFEEIYSSETRFGVFNLTRESLKRKVLFRSNNK